MHGKVGTFSRKNRQREGLSKALECLYSSAFAGDGPITGTTAAKRTLAMIDRIFASTTYSASKELLDAAALRQEALAANLANAETPGYKRVDLDPSFGAEFAARLRAGESASAPQPKLVEDTGGSVRTDGNNVEIDKELLAMGKNGTEYEALTEFVSGSLKQLRMAITGHSA